jgi:hypothetical protein
LDRIHLFRADVRGPLDTSHQPSHIGPVVSSSQR